MKKRNMTWTTKALAFTRLHLFTDLVALFLQKPSNSRPQEDEGTLVCRNYLDWSSPFKLFSDNQ